MNPLGSEAQGTLLFRSQKFGRQLKGNPSPSKSLTTAAAVGSCFSWRQAFVQQSSGFQSLFQLLQQIFTRLRNGNCDICGVFRRSLPRHFEIQDCRFDQFWGGVLQANNIRPCQLSSFALVPPSKFHPKAHPAALKTPDLQL